jgi:alkanesulfonate monooxygenase SsuD/methylene tetrahydromethanopterin reductase-like flavin-dependent oxidoreductase (luciferase family)
VKLGVYIGYWSVGMGSADLLRTVEEAERLGYDSVWTAEAYGSDAATPLAWLAAGTTTIRLGAGIFQAGWAHARRTSTTA